jgi:rhodanese-related sulfurtransferase
METPAVLMERARERATKMKLPYAGALLPGEAYDLMQGLPEAKLVDVRTQAEWDWVGRIPGALMIEWNTWPSGEMNEEFLSELESQVSKGSTPVLFICRSGARSHGAATLAARAGYASTFNVLEGFEGDKDALGHRSSVGGWRAAGLPWIQS